MKTLFTLIFALTALSWQPAQAQTLQDATRICAADNFVACLKRDSDQAGFIIKHHYKRQLINHDGQPRFDKTWAIVERHRAGEIRTFYSVYRCSTDSRQHRAKVVYKEEFEVYESKIADIPSWAQEAPKPGTVDWDITQIMCDEAPTTETVDLRDREVSNWFMNTARQETIIREERVRKCQASYLEMSECIGTEAVGLALQKQANDRRYLSVQERHERMNCQLWEVPLRGNLNDAEWQEKLRRIDDERIAHCDRVREEQKNRPAPVSSRPDWRTEQEQLREQYSGRSQNNQGPDLVNRAVRQFFNR